MLSQIQLGHGKRISTDIPRSNLVVGKLLINIADIYCLGTGLLISRSQHIFHYRHFK